MKQNIGLRVFFMIYMVIYGILFFGTVDPHQDEFFSYYAQKYNLNYQLLIDKYSYEIDEEFNFLPYPKKVFYYRSGIDGSKKEVGSYSFFHFKIESEFHDKEDALMNNLIHEYKNKYGIN